MSRPSDRPARPRRSGWAIAAISLGLLILVPSGLCTGAVGFVGAMNGGDSELVLLALTVGGVPLLIGIGLLVLGLNLPRKVE